LERRMDLTAAELDRESKWGKEKETVSTKKM
jgi:hypothetical protein